MARTNLVKKIQNTIFQYKLFERGDKIVLAVSGGPDSVTMLHVFSRLEKKYNLELIIAHVNYALRGNDSKKDEELVRNLAKKYGYKIFVLHPVETRFIASNHKKETQLIASPQKTPSENYLRDIRYEFFEKIRKENNFHHIAVAHNQDDQVETFFMRIIRGTGLRGLSAMKYKNGNIIRPLLSNSRAMVEEYIKENKLEYRIDKTNLESKYLRNKIRNKLIPYLEKNFNPQIKKTVSSGVETIAEDYALINDISAEAYTKHQKLRIESILKLPISLQKRLIIQALGEKGAKDIESSHVSEIMKIISSTKGKRQIFSLGGLKVIRLGDKLKIDTTNK
jgi:tRNA(Ile)-lysidine synthase